MRNLTLALAVLVLAAQPCITRAEQLRPETLSAWDDYVVAAKARLEARIAAHEPPFLRIDESRELARRVRAGEIVVSPTQRGNPRKVPHGLIHDWVGAVFVPHVTLDTMLRVLNDYDRYEEFYKPQIVRSRLLKDTGTEQTFTLVLVQKEFGVTAAIDAEMDGQVTRIDETRAYRYASSTRVQAIEHFGRPDERMDAAETGPGYVWRLLTGWRLEERDGGVYVEMETVAMSRGIPFEVRWLIEPLTNRMPRDLVARILASTRDAAAREGQPHNP